MKLFENEILNINRIVTVAKYETEKEQNGEMIVFYNPKLPTYELIFFLSGDANTYYNGVKIRDRDNCIRYLPKGVQASEYRVERSAFGECIDIYFDTDDKLPSVALGIEDIPELKNLFLKIYNLWSSKKQGYYTECMALFYEIIGMIKKRGESYLPKNKLQKLDKAHEYIVENFCSREFDYDELCACTGLSYSYFKELFIAKYGMPPVKYLTHLRLEYARELLITGRYSVSEIAQMCGFENVYYFSSVFKKAVGVSPKNYLKSI